MYDRSVRALSSSTIHYDWRLVLITGETANSEEETSEYTDLEQDIVHGVEFQKCRKGTSEIYRDLEPVRLSV
jgi:hypothetical protein